MPIMIEIDAGPIVSVNQMVLIEPMALRPLNLGAMTSFGETELAVDVTIPLEPVQFDYATDSKSKLLQQFKNKPKFAAWLEIHSAFATELEQVLLTIDAQRDLANAVGVQLDKLGSLMGVQRHGLSDDDYRVFLEARAAVVGSSSDLESIIRVLQIFASSFGFGELDVRQEPNTIIVHCQVGSWQQALGALVAEQLADIPAAAYKLILEYETPEALFTFVEA